MFIGREKELDNIHDAIKQYPLGVVLIGIGGVGKSETARKYLELHQHCFDGNVIWINASTRISLEETFIIIAESLEFEILNQSTKKQKSIKTVIKMVHDYFEDEKMLFIFDNCSKNTKDQIAEFISARHSTIITSQLKNWGQNFLEIEINQLTHEESELFLKNNLDQNEIQDKDSQESLLYILDRHPLALQHAVAYIKENKITPAEYLFLLEEHKILLLSTEVTLNLAASASVLKCLDMTLQQIKSKSTEAFKLINLISFLDGKEIYKELLKFVFKKNLEFQETLRLLLSHSIIKSSILKIPEKGPVEVVTVHCLYQTAVRADQERNGTVKKSIDAVFDLFF